jgi:glutamate racemase
MKRLKKTSIGVFDSGFGGLSIMKAIVKKMPEYNYIYLGDTARIPYGSRSQEVIYKFTEQAVDFLFKAGCQLIILACNTASSEALRKIQQDFLPKHYPKRRVLGVIIPAVEAAVQLTKNNRIGLIGTEGTVNSGAFEREIKKLNPKIKIFQKACPLLVPIVEADEEKSLAADLILRKYLKPLINKKIDTLILGCTHYGVLENKIRKITGSKINLVTEGEVVAEKLDYYLERHPEVKGNIAKGSNPVFFTTDLTDKFKVLGSKFFSKNFSPQKIELV